MWLQNIRFGPSNVITSESNSSIDENNRYNTDSERGATTLGPKEKKFKITNYPRFAITSDIQGKIH